MGKSVKKKEKNFNKKRHYIQALGFFAVNGNLKGFFEGKIYQGNLKKICLPVLNCYSCPGAVSGCPIGSIQATINGSRFKIPYKFHFPYYVMGVLSLFAILAGRLYCGYICPFGFFQDLLYKLPTYKIKVPGKLNSVLKYLKYAVLAAAVFILPFLTPLLFGDKYNVPYFCKYICPSGTLLGSFPHLLYEFFAKPKENRWMTAALGFLFVNKLTVFLLITALSVFIYRIFCRYICPLGAFLGLFNPVSLYKMKINGKCINCKRCQRVCKMNIPVYKTPNSFECIRCDECVKACPVEAIEKEYPFSGKLETAVFSKLKKKRSPLILNKTQSNTGKDS